MKILIVKTSAIGDLIQTFPALAYLRKKFPDAEISWVAEQACAPLVEAHPLVDHVHRIHTKKWRRGVWRRENRKEIAAFIRELRAVNYDLLFDFQGNSKSAFVTASARALEKVGFSFGSLPEKLNLLATRQRYSTSKAVNVRERYLQLVQQHFGEQESFRPAGVALRISVEERAHLSALLSKLRAPVYMVCFASNWRNKELSDETLLGMLEKISDRDHPHYLFIYGNERERERAEALQRLFPGHSTSVGGLSLPLWQALMARVQLVVAMDSAALHLCGTTDTPSFSVFGPSRSAVYKPLGAQHLAFQGECPYLKRFVGRCPVLRSCPTGACIRGLKSEELLAYQNQHGFPPAQSPRAPSPDPPCQSSLCRK